jgi:hypothetical protein
MAQPPSFDSNLKEALHGPPFQLIKLGDKNHSISNLIPTHSMLYLTNFFQPLRKIKNSPIDKVNENIKTNKISTSDAKPGF